MDSDAVARVVLFVTMVGTGWLLIWMARAAADGRLGRNQVAGIRIPSTMRSDAAWLAGHRAAENPTRLAGWVAIASAVPALLPVSVEAMAVTVGVGCLVLLALVVHAARLAGQAARGVED